MEVHKPFNPKNKNRENIHEFESFEFEFITAKDIQAKPQPWLWPGLIPLHTLTLFAGEGGIGKSQLLIEVAAKVSTGEKFNAGGIEHKLPQGGVLILTAEDDFEYTLMPKLIANNANVSEIHVAKMSVGSISKKKRFIDLNTELDKLKEKVKLYRNIKLIIVDPALYFIGNLRDNYNTPVANFLGELIDFAKEFNLALVLNKHFRKKASGTSITSAMDEVGGAGAWTNSPRLSWAITRYHDDESIITISRIKSNITKQTDEVYGYKLENIIITTEDGVSIPTTKLMWLDKLIHLKANEAVNKEVFEKSKSQVAFDFIVNYLTINGQSVAKAVKDEAEKKGIKMITLERAVKDLKDKKMINIQPGFAGNKLWNLVNNDDNY